MSLRRAVFFDRDGVLNDAIVRDEMPFPPTELSEVRLAEGAIESVARLRDAGFLTICITNQPDVARGALAREIANAINAYVAAELGLDEIVACFHDDRDDCPCRKPRPGMILASAARWSIDASGSYLVGDRWRDIDAGSAAGCRTVLLDRKWPERAPRQAPAATFTSLPAAVTWILQDARRET